MLYIIGLGLSDLDDISLKGFKAIEASSQVYLEHYTSILKGDVDTGDATYSDYKSLLEKFYNKEIRLADRDLVEQNSDEIIEAARNETVSFLVVGDPFGATTHTDLVLRAIEKGVKYKIIHNASILNAVGCCGLQLYNYGEIVSICFWSEGWRPKSYFSKILDNKQRGLHTLCLLDIKVKERSVENLMKGRNIYEPPRYMSVAQACSQLIEIFNDQEGDEEEEKTKPIELVQSKRNLINENTLCVGLARVGSDNQQIVVDRLINLAQCDLGEPLHSLIVIGRLHPLEIEFLKLFYPDKSTIKFEILANEHNKVYS